MSLPLPLAELPSQSATQVKNSWGDVVRQVHQAGSLAITNHSTVELVLITADKYNQMAKQLGEMSAALDAFHTRDRQAKLEDLKRRFTDRLAVLQRPDAREQVTEFLNAKGKMKGKRPIAGETY